MLTMIRLFALVCVLTGLRIGDQNIGAMTQVDQNIGDTGDQNI